MAIKRRVRTWFSALMAATSPITLIKNGLAYTIGLDITALRSSLDAIYAPVSSISTDPTFYAYDFGVRGDGGSYTTQMQNCFNAAKAAGGGVIVLPAGSFICGDVSYITSNSGVNGQGLQLRGQGAEATQIIFSGASNFWLTLDTTADGKWQSFVKISDFKLTAVGTKAGGISVHRCAYITIERMHFLTTGTALYNTASGDPDSTFQGLCRHVRFDNCGLTAGTFGVDILPSGTAVEISNWRFEGCQWEACGVPGAVANPPTSGAMRYRGLILDLLNCAFTTNQNVSLYLAKTGGVQAVTIESCDFENTISTVHPHIFVDSGVRLFKANNIQFLNQDAWVCRGGIWFDSTSGVQANITIDGATVRVSTGNNPYTCFRQLGTSSNWHTDTNRVRNVNWQIYDGTGQNRFSGWRFDQIPAQCILQISAVGTAKLFPAGGGNVMPIRAAALDTAEWVPVQIPTAGITAAGLSGLSANTQYNFYLSNSGTITQPIIPQITLSSAAPTIDATEGYYVSSANAGLLYLGSYTTDGTGTFQTTATGYSWLPYNPSSFGRAIGTTTNDSASPGQVGELINSNILSASGVALTTGTPANVATITLTPGDWDISAMPVFSGGATTTVTALRASISTGSATENPVSPFVSGAGYSGLALFASVDAAHPIAPVRVSLAGAQTYFLVVSATFGTSTCKAYGNLRARRVR